MSSNMNFMDGIAFAVLSAICNGSFGSVSKLRIVNDHGVTPQLLNFFAGLGACVSGLILLVYLQEVNFTPFGLLSGALFVLSLLCSFTAIQALDSVAIAAGIWCGVAMVTSFVFGALVDSAPQSWPLAALSIALMVLAVIGITCTYLSNSKAAHHQASSPWHRGHGSPNLSTAPDEADEAVSIDVQSWAAEQYHETVESTQIRDHASFGIAAAIAAGAIGGLILAPMYLAPTNARGLAFVPSFSIGAGLAAPLMLLTMLRCWSKERDNLETELLPGSPMLSQASDLEQEDRQALARSYGRRRWATAAVLGSLAGFIWNVGNACSILATDQIGLAVAYPIMQCGLFVAGAWGCLFFAELPGWSCVQYLGCSCVLIAGAAGLSAAG